MVSSLWNKFLWPLSVLSWLDPTMVQGL
jgi:hypothetical protein